jgi:uncharacterized protein
MKNPFKYGESVSGEHFTNRRKEIADIKSAIRSAQNIFIYSFRRLGKTSLIKTVLQSLAGERSIIPVYVDLQRAPSVGQFVEIYSAAIGQAFIARGEKLKKIGALFKMIIPSFELTETGGWKISFDFSKTTRGTEKALEEVYELPQKIAVERGKRVVVVFDEFQEISQYDGSAFEKKLRSFIQHHNEVCYIFMGSKTQIILEMFQDPRRAFYNSADIYPLPLIPGKDLVDFIIERFASTGKRIARATAGEIVSLSRRSPYHIQMLSAHIWTVSGNKVKKENIRTGLDAIMLSQNELFFSWYDSSSLHQRAVLGALAQTRKIFSRDVILTHNLGSSSTVQASLKALTRTNLVTREDGKYWIFDPFFEIWLQKKMEI